MQRKKAYRRALSFSPEALEPVRRQRRSVTMAAWSWHHLPRINVPMAVEGRNVPFRDWRRVHEGRCKIRMGYHQTTHGRHHAASIALTKFAHSHSSGPCE